MLGEMPPAPAGRPWTWSPSTGPTGALNPVIKVGAGGAAVGANSVAGRAGRQALVRASWPILRLARSRSVWKREAVCGSCAEELLSDAHTGDGSSDNGHTNE